MCDGEIILIWKIISILFIVSKFFIPILPPVHFEFHSLSDYFFKPFLFIP